ncbi:hypothetical protein LQU92_04200 [Kocuria sp. LUK]|uniref:hypothetical protein n=1 Tax=Kocuria sp. LUK TaxID=2897828 RepID=UPI001E2DF520|nr:hypothetical protein [Kocuria sp. LUK]MCD1144444.1 hypothetical protein [Kocuria sp. LUK]
MTQQTKVRFRDYLGKPRNQWTQEQQEHANRSLIILVIVLVLYIIGSTMANGGSADAGTGQADHADAATQDELNTWVTDMHQEALDFTGARSWDERCGTQMQAIQADLKDFGSTSTTTWACQNPQFTVSTIGELDVTLDTDDLETAEDASGDLMASIGYARDDIQVVRVYGSHGGLLSETERSEVPALNL